MDIVLEYVLTSAESPLLGPSIDNGVPHPLPIEPAKEQPEEPADPGVLGEPEARDGPVYRWDQRQYSWLPTTRVTFRRDSDDNVHPLVLC